VDAPKYVQSPAAESSGKEGTVSQRWITRSVLILRAVCKLKRQRENSTVTSWYSIPPKDSGSGLIVD
jgi:hypothetical protein